MTTEAVITAIFGALAALVSLYLKLKPSIDKKRDDDEKQKLRKAVAEGDVASVNAAVDGLSDEASNTERQCNDEDIQRRLAQITGK